MPAYDTSDCVEVLTPSMPLDPFYHGAPRFVHAVDDAARLALTAAYSEGFVEAAALAIAADGRYAEPRALDLCASWTHGWPEAPLLETGVGIGLCAPELERAGFDEWHVLDISCERLPVSSDYFHIVTCNCGMPYLQNPKFAISEAFRVTKPGGQLLIAFSDRVIAPERATKEWLSWNEAERVQAVTLWATAAGFSKVVAADASPLKGVTDSLILIRAIK